MSNILEQGYSARYLIFNRPYPVKVKNLETLSREYIEQRGMVYTGIKEVDEAMANELIVKYLTIAQMAELYKDGVALRFSRREQVDEIYAIIHRHISDFQQHMNKSINITRIPVEDLKLLSEFASEIFKYVSDTDFTKDTIDMEIFNTKLSSEYFDANKFFTKEPRSVSKKKEEERLANYYKEEQTPVVEPVKAPHEEVMQDIEDRMLYRSQKWRPL